MNKSKFHIAFLSAAILVSTTTFFSCSKDDETPEKTENVKNDQNSVTPGKTDDNTAAQDDPKTTEISESIKALAEKTTDGSPVELSLDEKITDEDFKFVAQALIKNENVDVALNLSKVEISSIPEEAFKDVKNLTEVILPTTISEIKKAAFKDCIGLKNVTFDSKISKNSTEATIKIGASAFENCSDLDSVNISSNNIEIDPTAFENTEIAVLADNTFKAFKDAKYAQRVHVLAHVTEIPVKAFYLETTRTSQYLGEEYTHRYNDYLKDVTFAKNSKLTKIGSGAFWGCYFLEEMNLPESLKIIGDTVFTDCYSRFKLASMPSNVEELGAAALRGLGENKIVELPASLKKITGDSLFGYNSNPNIIKFAKNSQIKEISKDAFLYHSVIYYDDNMNSNYTELHLPIFCELNFKKDWWDINAEDKKRRIYVPQNLVEQFKAAECYKDCDIIAEE